MPLEERMLLHLQEYIQIPRRSAVRARLPFRGKPQPIPIRDTGRDRHLQFAIGLFEAFPAALAARALDNLPRAVATRAGPAHRKEALLIQDLAAPAALRARRRPAPRLRAL